jgi:hypothetical protein
MTESVITCYNHNRTAPFAFPITTAKSAKEMNSGFLNCSIKKTKSGPIFGQTYQFCYFSLNQSMRMLFQSELVT